MLARCKGVTLAQINTYRQSDNELLCRDKIPYLDDPHTYEYDDNGNMTQSVDELGTRTYSGQLAPIYLRRHVLGR